MGELKYLDNMGTFTLDNPDLASYMYFPLTNELGMMSSITPDLNGDIKLNQDMFLLEPVSSENLHNNKSSRNFWVYAEGKGAWSVTGRSALQQSKLFDDDKEEVKLTAGILWHKTERSSKDMELKSVVTSFVPLEDKVELTKVEIENVSDKTQKITSTMAVPMYARSAGDIRDHRHVTSLLHRTVTVKNGIIVCPTLTFDERGHNKNTVYYGAFAKEKTNEEMKSPVSFCPVTEEFIGEGGNFENPYYVVKNKPLPYKAGEKADGYETVAAIRFADCELKPGEKKTYIIALGYGESEADFEKLENKYISVKAFDKYLEDTNNYWQNKIDINYRSSDEEFDNWMHWVNFQPVLRRIYGCSFLPHHDYGKGGRGWRDLWQDCLALLIMEPEKVRQMLIDNFGGVRLDGTNATIIGTKQGEFIADRNNITRVWMDHGAWPCLTTELYIQQTGDIEFLTEENTYFKDLQISRGEQKDTEWTDEQGSLQQTEEMKVYKGTVLEHMLIQHLTAFYDVGEHNHIKLRGADWNDGLDMAAERGESVAFTALYGGNLRTLAKDIKAYSEKTGKTTVLLAKELLILLNVDKTVYDITDEKREVLDAYCDTVKHTVSGVKVNIRCDELCSILNDMSEWIIGHIRKTELITDKEGYSWFNGYYDNNANAVEGDFESGVRMMLTGQVFAVMTETASDKQTKDIIKAADRYLYDKSVGGYRLNTDFKEVKTDFGRTFGFAFGHKENGAVFSHMAVMYANALYGRGFAKEGYKVIKTLYKHCINYNVSRIYPGIPEYINQRGRGMYHYLTGSASWMLITVLNEMYGIKGIMGNLVLKPQLLSEQFKDGQAMAECRFRNIKINVTYKNPLELEAGEYKVTQIYINGEKYGDTDTVLKEDIEKSENSANITAILGKR